MSVEPAPTDHSVLDLGERLVDVIAPLVPDPQTTRPLLPTECALRHPAVAPQLLSALDAPAGQARHDPALSEALAQFLVIFLSSSCHLLVILSSSCRHTPCPRAASGGVGAACPACLAPTGSRPPSPAAAGRPGRWPPRAPSPAAGRSCLPPGGAWCPACPGPQATGRPPGCQSSDFHPCGWRPPFFRPLHADALGADEDRVHAGAAPINEVGRLQPRQQCLVEPLPDAGLVPVPQPAPAGHARAAAHLFGQHLPGDAAPQNEQDARKSLPVRHPKEPPGPARGAARACPAERGGAAGAVR